MTTAYIGLGSNLDAPIEQLKLSITAIAAIEQSKLIAISSLYGSRPMGPQDQPDYINAVLAITTELSPLALLDQLQTIELNAGRVRKDERWGARVLDLDIILFGQQQIQNERLTVPHYGMNVREFVLLPLAEIAPDFILPSGENVSILAANIDPNGLAIKEKINLSDFTG
ncbi:MAG: 2-amino-4-hydroxy-6-hydroxymethyldihydropteridine diphosphokinase [Thalassotalea sp.]